MSAGEIYTPARSITVTEGAKMLRKVLRAAFPGVKFSVRSSRYAGGSSIRISWTDGPIAADVNRIGQMFAGSTFDGMRDLKEHHRTLITTDDGAELVQFHCDFVFAERSISPEWREELLQEMEETHGGPINPDGSLPYRTLRAADAERLGCQVGALWPDDSRSEFVGVLIHQMAAGRVR